MSKSEKKSVAAKSAAIEAKPEAPSRKVGVIIDACFESSTKDLNGMLDVVRYIKRKHNRQPRRFWYKWEDEALTQITHALGNEIVYAATRHDEDPDGNWADAVAAVCDSKKLADAIVG